MSRDRGQVVLLAAVVVAVALVAMVLAYAQLGADTARPAVGVESDVDDTRRALSASFSGAVARTDGEYAWSERAAAADEVRTEVAGDVTRIERANAAAERSLRIGYNGSAAAGWAARNCPDGPGRAFGPCRVADGVVVQQRANETAVVAAAFDLAVLAPDERTNATVVVEAV